MFTKLFTANDDWTGVVLRVTLGVVLLAHGAQKLLGWFGGYGFTGTMQFFTETMHFPWIVGFMVIMLETLGALLLIAGLGSRLLATAMIFLFIGIVLTVHAPNGFFMNWFGNHAGEGYEYFVLDIGLALGVILNGAGRYSLDRLLTKQTKAKVLA